MCKELNELEHNFMLELEMKMNLKGFDREDLKKIFLNSKSVYEYMENLKKELLK